MYCHPKSRHRHIVTGVNATETTCCIQGDQKKNDTNQDTMIKESNWVVHWPTTESKQNRKVVQVICI